MSKFPQARYWIPNCSWCAGHRHQCMSVCMNYCKLCLLNAVNVVLKGKKQSKNTQVYPAICSPPDHSPFLWDLVNKMGTDLLCFSSLSPYSADLFVALFQGSQTVGSQPTPTKTLLLYIVWFWSLGGPDLNPIENMWTVLNIQVCARKPTNCGYLSKVIEPRDVLPKVRMCIFLTHRIRISRLQIVKFQLWQQSL